MIGIKKGKKDDLLFVYLFRSDRHIYSVMKREKFESKDGVDSTVAYQFCYINDTLLRVWFYRLYRIHKKNGAFIAYINRDRIVAQKKIGDIYMPDLKVIKNKLNELKTFGTELIKSTL